MREYMQDYRDKREPERVWRRLVIFFLVMGSRTKSHPAPSHGTHFSLAGPVQGLKFQPVPLHVGHLAQSWMAMAL